MSEITAPDQSAIREMLDRDSIFNLVRLERFWRDQCEWDKLEASFTEDGVVRVSWFEGSAHDFAEGSRGMRHSGTLTKHLILPTHLRLNGNRALAESYGQVHLCDKLDGIEYELICHCRFLSRVVRTTQGWRLATLECIYIRDVMSAIKPWETLVIDPDRLAKQRHAYRFLSYVLSARYKINQVLPGDDRPDILEKLYKAASDWLETGA
jgi:hypothetical protein